MNFLYDSDKIEIRLPFYRYFSAFWYIFGGLCTQFFYSSILGIKWLETWSHLRYKIKSHTTTTQIQNQKFSKIEQSKEKITHSETKNKLESAAWSHYKHHNN